MPNGLSIKSQDDFKKLYEDDPGLALGLIFQNLSDLKIQCSSRLPACQNDMIKRLSNNRKKIAALQTGGGIVGGAVAAWAFLKIYATDLFK